MIKTHMGFELECWSWCFWHECFVQRERYEARGQYYYY